MSYFFSLNRTADIGDTLNTYERLETMIAHRAPTEQSSPEYCDLYADIKERIERVTHSEWYRAALEKRRWKTKVGVAIGIAQLALVVLFLCMIS